MAEDLIKLPDAPAPDADAKGRTAFLALAAFGDFHAEGHIARQSSQEERIPPNRRRNSSMPAAKRNHRTAAIAASVAALMAAGVAGIVATDPGPQPKTNQSGPTVFSHLIPPREPSPGPVERIRQAFRKDQGQRASLPSLTDTSGSLESEVASNPHPPAPPPSVSGTSPAVQPPPQGAGERYDAAPMQRAPQGIAPAMPASPSQTYIPDAAPPREPSGRDQFEARPASGFLSPAQQPTSTFSMDVDTSSYSFARASIGRGQLPPPESVRTEEFVNALPYSYPAPGPGEGAIRTTVTLMPSPWAPGRQLMHVGIKAAEVSREDRPPANVTLLIDTSGSMAGPTRLPMAKRSLEILTRSLQPHDTVSIATYSGRAGIALEPTSASEPGRINAAIQALEASGGTAGFAGIQTAYELARRNFNPKGTNRVILVTDGDFNVGISSPEGLRSYVEAQRSSGIYLTVLGFGMGNYNDRTMQALARSGNGQAAYIDTIQEAQRVLSDQVTGTLVTVADDAKVQVEFNPRAVAEYRLVGYEKRALAHRDFANDKVDAGEVGSGHSVTAIYEIVPAGAQRAPSYRYAQPAPAQEPAGPTEEVATVSVRYKAPGERASRLSETRVRAADALGRFEAASDDARFAASVAAFAEVLRRSPHAPEASLEDIARTAMAARGADADGSRSEFARLARAAAALAPRAPVTPK